MGLEILREIGREVKEEIEREKANPPTACPRDGTPLLPDPRAGGFRCPFDGWHYPSDARP